MAIRARPGIKGLAWTTRARPGNKGQAWKHGLGLGTRARMDDKGMAWKTRARLFNKGQAHDDRPGHCCQAWPLLPVRPVMPGLALVYNPGS